MSKSETVYSPFNLLLLSPNRNGQYEGHYYCRGLEGCFISQSFGPEKLSSGFHGLSNHPINQPYQKTIFGAQKLEEIVQNHQDNLVEKLFDLMNDKSSHFPDSQMVKQGGEKSQMKEFHPKLACINVDISEKNYGTRTTTLILVDQNNNVEFLEKNKDEDLVKHSFRF